MSSTETVRKKLLLENPRTNGDFLLSGRAGWLHESLAYTRYLYPYETMLPIGKINRDFFHKRKKVRSKNSSLLLEARSPCSICVAI